MTPLRQDDKRPNNGNWFRNKESSAHLTVLQGVFVSRWGPNTENLARSGGSRVLSRRRFVTPAHTVLVVNASTEPSSTLHSEQNRRVQWVCWGTLYVHILTFTSSVTRRHDNMDALITSPESGSKSTSYRWRFACVWNVCEWMNGNLYNYSA